MKFCVIGLGRLGFHVAMGLAENGMEVLGIDTNEEIIASIRDRITQAICMHITDAESLRSIGIEEIDTVIVAVGEDFAQSILITALLKKKIGTKRVITRAVNEIHKDILHLVGADQVIIPEKDAGVRLADKLSTPFTDLIRLTDDFSISMIIAPAGLVGKKAAHINISPNYRAHCFAIQHNDEVMPLDNEYVIEKNDKLIFGGLNDDLEKIAKL